MGDAAILATFDIGRSLLLLETMTYTDDAFLRGLRFVQLAHSQECRLGFRSDNVETWLRYGFRILSRWAISHSIH